jgi:prolyl-tRNA editing enzyme YbaK/EbsC (Cys-tRNA(Pro) deacylase)
MSLTSVKAELARIAPDIEVLEHETSTATVALAAAVHGVEPGQIAKTLSLRVGDTVMLVVVRGDARLDNRKARAVFGGKARMLGAEEVEAITGHPVGGVCPFGLASPLPVHCDVSLKAYDEVVPAAGSTHSSLRIAPDRMAALTKAVWVDVCELREVQAEP